MWLFSNVCQNTAVYIYNVSVDKVGCIGSQENSGSLQILSCAPSCCRSLCNDELVKRMSGAVRLDLTERSGLRCCNITR